MDTEKFKDLLLQRKNSLLETLETENQAADTVELDQSKVGRLSRMDAMQAQAMSQETKRRHQLELIQIDAALQRIESNEYGICFECDEEISEKRLEITPSATLCIQCAERKQ